MLKYPWKSPFALLLLENFTYLGGYLSSHMHVQILVYDGSTMKISFQMFTFWLSKSLGF